MAGNLIVFFIYFPVPSLKKQTPFPGKRFQVCDVEKFLLAVRPAHCKTFLKSSPEGDLGGYSPKSPPVGDLHASGIFSRPFSLDSSQRNPSLRYGFLVRFTCPPKAENPAAGMTMSLIFITRRYNL